jgi:hypothetical protein
VGENDDGGPESRFSRVAFSAVAGMDYRIMVDGWDGAYGDFQLNVNPPVNDNFEQCALLAGLSGLFNGWTTGATVERGETAHASTFGRHSVWFCWRAPDYGTVTVDTIGSDFDTSLGIYQGTSLYELWDIASDNDSGGGAGVSRLQFSATKNVDYRFAVDGRGTASGNLTLNWRLAVNNRQLTARLLTGSNVELSIPGQSGEVYVFEHAAVFPDWKVLGNVTVQNGSARMVQPVSTGQRFYRARLLQ